MSSFFSDPTVLFTIAVVLTPLGFEINDPNFIELLKIYFLHAPFLICFALIIILENGTLFIPQKHAVPFKKKKRTNGTYSQPKGLKIRNILTTSDYMTSRWYLMNGLIYHSLMDPISGFWQNWSLMTKQYSYLDTRFANPYEIGAESATLTVWLEAAVMCPLCILIFIGYRYILPRIRNTSSKNKSKYASIVWIYCLEFVVCLCQSIGSYFFYGTEMILLFIGKDTHITYAKNKNELDFDIWECFYFWFGTIFMVAIWVIIPVILMIRAYGQIVSLINDKQIKKKKRK
eukprot:461248_1